MQPVPYRLLTQVGATRDGIAYRAEAADGTPVEVRDLTPLQADPERWLRLGRRLRLASLVDHPGALRLLEVCLDHEPPYLALEWAELAESASLFSDRPTERIALARHLADVLACAHHLGLAHGRVDAGSVYVAAGEHKLDFTGLSPRAAREAAEAAGEGAAGFPADVHGLGLLLAPLLEATNGADGLSRVIRGMLAEDPDARPSAREVVTALTELIVDKVEKKAPRQAFVDSALTTELKLPAPEDGPRFGPTRVLEHPDQADEVLARGRLGRFRLLEKLGQGGMGTVYSGRDEADGAIVAIKVLRADRSAAPEALRRFHKEARLLAEVQNPHVANLLEVNEDSGVHYLVMEFVAGTPLDDWVAEHGPLDEPAALTVLADVSRALAEAHERGIVHRDVKPANILLAESAGGEKLTPKLTDFGLARHVVETESLNLTRAGAVLGTPYYMAPEQAAGGEVGPRADVYALGATLFHVLTGRPPFVGSDPLGILTQHRLEPPPALQKLNSAVSDATCRLVERLLAKAPQARPADAGAVLREVERILRGEPVEATLHPRLPAATSGNVLQYEWTWELESSPQQLWPHVSNTDRLNRAVGLPAIRFTARAATEGGSERFGEIRKFGVSVAYREHPFEWIEARRMGVLREFNSGPFRWLVSIAELTPRAGGGTTLTHQVRLEPRGLLGRTAAAVEIGIKGKRGLDRVYRRIDAALTGALGSPALADPFEEPEALSAGRRRELERRLDQLSERGVNPEVIERLGDFLGQASPQEAARIRPLALARRFGLDSTQVVAACLHGARVGLLSLLWDLLCPVCRIPSEVKETLRELREHGRCEACNIDFELDFANSVELIFRANPEIRETELGTYCVGGPAHSPHVAAQVRLAPAERLELELALIEGAYRLRGPQLPYTLDFRVEGGASTSRLDLGLGGARPQEWPRTLRPGGQVLTLTNVSAHELLVRVERTAPRDDALTAARAASLALFRELFPDEVLSPGQLVSVATITLLVTELDQPADLYGELGDVRAFALVHEHFRLLEGCIRREGGALVKTVGDGVVAAFSEPAAAVEAALAMQAMLARNATTRDLRLRVAVHRGPALAATLNDQLDYFGATVREAVRLPGLVRGGDVLLTAAVSGDVRVAALLRSRGIEGEVVQGELPGALLRLTAPG